MSSNAYDKTSGLLHQIAGIPKSILNTLIAKADAALNNQASSIEPTTTATSAHLVGEYIIYGLSRKYAKVTSAIAIGDTIANGTNVDDITQGEVLTQLNSALTWKLLVSHAMNDVWTPTRDLPSDFREMMFVYHYSAIACSAILSKQAFISAGNTTNQHQTGWYATSTNAGGFYITYNNSKFSLYDFYYQSASHHDATCDVYYR